MARFLATSLAFAAVAFGALAFSPLALDVQADEPVALSPARQRGNHSVDAEEALRRLADGNARFVAGAPRHPHEAASWRSRLEKGQRPFAVVLGCSDSRVPPELVFDQGLGDLFVVRVAGNVVDTDVIASIEYATHHLDSKLIVVLGHSNCGAVSATLQHLAKPDGEPAEVVSLLYQMEPAVMGISSDQPHDEQVEQAVQRNVELAVRRLCRVPAIRRRASTGRVSVVGAIYDMHTGKVDLRACPTEFDATVVAAP